jgi:hypothetical protein
MPAQAGIQVDCRMASEEKLDSRFRGNDVHFVPESGIFLVMPAQAGIQDFFSLG